MATVNTILNCAMTSVEYDLIIYNIKYKSEDWVPVSYTEKSYPENRKTPLNG